MRDSWGNIIYVGKSKLLKNRVSSYFRGINSHPPKVRTMVALIKEFEYIITDTEMEALILEQTLIKKHQPKFNILLRDDKQYPFIRVTVEEKFPRVFMTRQQGMYKSRYFGPYTSVDAVRKTLEVLFEIYPIRTCSKNLEKPNGRPCLNFHIKKCLGPCQGTVHHEAYMEMIDAIMRFLSGHTEELLTQLESNMKAASLEMAFEKAGKYRDQIQAINSLMERQKMVAESDVSQDIIGIYTSEVRACIMMFTVRAGKLIGREDYIFEEEFLENKTELIESFMYQHYSNTTDYPKEVILDEILNEQELLENYISKNAGFKVRVTQPQRGEKRKMLDMLLVNAKEYLDKFEDKITYELAKTTQLENQLSEILGFKQSIRRVEAYDISNIYGVMSVGSMVVYENSKKKPRDYRRFKIKSVDGPNDYASMQEVVFRRISRGLEEQKRLMEAMDSNESGKFSIFPDLMLIDGGVGHVNAVLEVLEALKVNIPVAGMVKDNRHRTDQLYFRGQFYAIKEVPEVYRYIAGIQEEVHRFAIEYHKQLRTKSLMDSILDEIEDIGEKRRNNLLKHFKSIDNIKNASMSDLLLVEGMTKSAAEKVFKHFHQSAETKEMNLHEES